MPCCLFGCGFRYFSQIYRKALLSELVSMNEARRAHATSLLIAQVISAKSLAPEHRQETNLSSTIQYSRGALFPFMLASKTGYRKQRAQNRTRKTLLGGGEGWTAYSQIQNHILTIEFSHNFRLILSSLLAISGFRNIFCIRRKSENVALS